SLLGGADGISDRMVQSRDWVRHILGRRLATAPGEQGAHSNPRSHLWSGIVPGAPGQSTLAFARTRLFAPLGIATDNALEQKIRGWPPTQAQLKAYEQAKGALPRSP